MGNLAEIREFSNNKFNGDKLLGSLALIKSNWFGQDYMNSFIPFIATLINKNNYEIIDLNEIIIDFEKEFGFKIPRHPMIDILKRCCQSGVIRSYLKKYYPVKEKIVELDFSKNAENIIYEHDKTINEFVIFAKDRYNISFEKEKAEMIFISFLDENAVNTLLGSVNSIESDMTKTSEKFVFCSFIKDVYENRREIFSYITDIALGHMIASAVTFDKISGYQGTLKNLNIYIDTKFILRLLGVEGEERESAYIDLVKELSLQKAKLYIFEHTYNEVFDILKDCERWIENENYNAKYASEALKSFIQRKWTIQEVRVFVNSISEKLQVYNIKIDDTDYYKYLPDDYQMDDKKFEDMLISNYKRFSVNFNELDKQSTIQKDVKSISYVYKLRRGKKPKKLKESQYIFLTTNGSLAYVSKEFAKQDNGGSFCIPQCTTDVFLGTVIWLQSSVEKAYESGQKKLIADCYAALKPNDLLIKKFYDEIQSLKSTGKITEDEFILLRCCGVESRYLEEKTLGDVELFKDEIAEEILEEVKSELKAPIIKELLNERNLRKDEENRRIELEAQNRANEEKILNHELEKLKKIDEQKSKEAGYLAKAEKRVDVLVNLILPVCSSSFAAFAVFAQIIPLIKNQYIIYRVISSILTVIGVTFIGCTKANLFNIKQRLIKYLIKTYVVKEFKNNLSM